MMLAVSNPMLRPLKGPGMADRSVAVRQTVSQSVKVERPTGSFYLEGLPEHAVKGTTWGGKVYPAGTRNGMPVYATSLDDVPALVNPPSPAAPLPQNDRVIERAGNAMPVSPLPTPTGEPPVSVVVTAAPPSPPTDIVWVASVTPPKPTVELVITSAPPIRTNPPVIVTPVPAPPPATVAAAPQGHPRAGFLAGFYHGLSSPLRVFKLWGMGFAPGDLRSSSYYAGLTFGCLLLVLALLVLVDRIARVDPESEPSP